MADNGDFDAIVTGCNCQKTMGAGIALQIKERYPQAYQADLDYNHPIPGEFSIAEVPSIHYFQPPEFYIVNLYSQRFPGKPNNADQTKIGRSDTEYDRYQAIFNGMTKVNNLFLGQTVGIPHIGAGLAGLNWGRIESILRDTTKGLAELVIVEYKE